MRTADEEHRMTPEQIYGFKVKADSRLAQNVIGISTAGQDVRWTVVNGDPVAAILARRSASRSS